MAANTPSVRGTGELRVVVAMPAIRMIGAQNTTWIVSCLRYLSREVMGLPSILLVNLRDRLCGVKCYSQPDGEDGSGGVGSCDNQEIKGEGS